MKLLTAEIKRKLPKLYATDGLPNEERMVVAKFFDPYGSWTWYVLEGEEQEDGDWLFFGLVEGFEKEFGYFSLRELESSEKFGRQRIERDKYFDPVPLTEVN